MSSAYQRTKFLQFRIGGGSRFRGSDCSFFEVLAGFVAVVAGKGEAGGGAVVLG
jgi:hypothetical protein